MKKLSVLQWIALLSAFIGLLMESKLLGDSEIINEVVGKILIVLGLAKTTYDLYMSFQTQDVADFNNDNNVGATSKGVRSTKQDVRNWVSNK